MFFASPVIFENEVFQIIIAVESYAISFSQTINRINRWDFDPNSFLKNDISRCMRKEMRK